MFWFLKRPKKSADLVSFHKENSVNLDRAQIFRYAKFMTQTYTYYKKINRRMIPYAFLRRYTPEVIRKSKLFDKDIHANKLLYRALTENLYHAPAKAKKGIAEKLFLLNSIYSLKFFEAITRLGTNSHEKSAFLFIAQRNYTDKIILNKPLIEGNHMIVKEFDALILKPGSSVLVEDKAHLAKDAFRQIFGYNTQVRRTSHADIFSHWQLRQKNKIPPIRHIEIVYTTLDKHLKNSGALGRLLAKQSQYHSLYLPVKDFCQLAENLLTSDCLKYLKKQHTVKNIIFTRIDPLQKTVTNKCLNNNILDFYKSMLAK